MDPPLIVCLGLSVVDLVFTVDEAPQAGTKQFARTVEESVGGPAATASVAIVRLGGRARFVGRVGDDRRGSVVVEALERAGVEPAVEVVAGETTPVSAVFVTPDGERTIVNHTDAHLFSAPPPPHPTAGAAAALADARWPAGALVAMTDALGRGIPGVLDLDRAPVDDHPRLWEIVAASSHVVASRTGAADITGERDPAAAVGAIAARSGWGAVTAGPGGVHWVGGHEPAPAVTAVDTLGAGDVFHGAFALALAEQKGEHEALRFATAAAALSCTRTGGWSSIPDRGAVDTMMLGTWN